ncbi:hypothetical protein D3C71_1436220 [compost metagenome]
MMGCGKVHSSSVNIELFAKVFCTHRRTFNMPSRETFSPWRGPAHQCFWFCFDPKCKIQSSALFILSTQFPGIGQHIFQVSIGQDGIIIFLTIFFYVKINGSICLISISIADDLFDHFNLFYNMTCSSRLNAWRQCIKHPQDIMKSKRIFLHDFHWLQLLQFCSFCKLVITFITIPFQVAGIGNVPHITHFISAIF